MLYFISLRKCRLELGRRQQNKLVGAVVSAERKRSGGERKANIFFFHNYKENAVGKKWTVTSDAFHHENVSVKSVQSVNVVKSSMC